MLAAVLALAVHASTPVDYRPDLNLLIDSLKQYGAYVKEDRVDLDSIKSAYSDKFANVSDKDELMALFESVVGELHDFHASLGANNQASPRLVPSGTDIYATWTNDRAVVEQVKTGSWAERAGIQPGDEVTQISGQPVRIASSKWFGVRKPDDRAWEWALNSALAGRWNAKRKLTVLRGKALRVVELETAQDPEPAGVLTVEDRGGSILYLRPENSLGDPRLISEFDKAVPRLMRATKVVIDLRNTPSGGTSSVARGILGLFIDKRRPYQRHRVEERDTGTVRDWVEYATPRLTRPVTAKLAVLVGRWTGSMGEGIAVGFDAMKRATIVGTPMARLRGAIDRLDLPLAGFSVGFPTEQVFHVNGKPRHEWSPRVKVKPGPGDPWWDAAVKALR